MLKTSQELLDKANQESYAVGAFNTNNLEITKAIFSAAEIEKAPLIIQITPSAMAYAGVSNLASLVRVAEQETGIPVALHLDHGKELVHIIVALRNGFSSVMIDGSLRPYKENVAITKEVVKIAHSVGVTVEAELGKIVRAEEEIAAVEREAAMTDPEQAAEFVAETGIDALAISIGNAHGWYKGKPKLDFERLAAIKEAVTVPLVLHGGTGIPDKDIEHSIKLGIRKINIDTEIRTAFKRGVTEFITKNPNVIDPRKILKPAIENVVEVVRNKIQLFGAAGRAEKEVLLVKGRAA
jgi:fructose-bisphosphate aldolase class II